MKFIKAEKGIYLNAAMVENFKIDHCAVVAWTIGDDESPYEIKSFNTAAEAEEYKAKLVAKLGDVVNEGL